MATVQDLQEMLIRLKRVGYTLGDVAEFCECSISVVSRIRLGEAKRPSHKVADGIIRMHDMRLPKLENNQ